MRFHGQAYVGDAAGEASALRPWRGRGSGARLAAVVFSLLLVPAVPAVAQQSASGASDPSGGAAKAAPGGRYKPDRFAGRARKHYQLVWGIDSLSVRLTESGEVVRFSYRVLDAEKAKALNDGRNEPSLVDERAGVSRVVPAMEKIGKLRQSGTPEAGKAYWMAFSNKGRPVKKGDRVDVVIGQFRANGLVVD